MNFLKKRLWTRQIKWHKRAVCVWNKCTYLSSRLVFFICYEKNTILRHKKDSLAATQLLSLYIYIIRTVKLSWLKMSALQLRKKRCQEEVFAKQTGSLKSASPTTHIVFEDILYSVNSPFALHPFPLVWDKHKGIFFPLEPFLNLNTINERLRWEIHAALESIS